MPATARWRCAAALIPSICLASPLAAAQDSQKPARAVASTPGSQPAPSGRFVACNAKSRWGCCDEGTSPCTRSRPARLLLAGTAALVGGVAAGLLFALGDRNAGGDPSTLLVGGTGVALVGALLGAGFGRLGADGVGHPDRVRPPTLGLDWIIPQPAKLDERAPHSLAFRIAPTYFFPDNAGRIRLFGHVGGTLGTRKDIDPRPQTSATESAIRERELSGGLGLDLAVALPYPVLRARRSSFLGSAEIRYKPEFQIRREVFDPGEDDERVLERTMLLPLTVGMRWHLSPRQRFTFYAGPRFDFIAFSEPGSRRVRRGPAQFGPIYGEAWYDIDFPFTMRARRDGKARRASVIGMLSGGYVHSRFDGRGLNFGPVIGFLGPIHVVWHTRVRPVGWPVALQGSLGAWIGSGYGLTAAVGTSLPDLGRRRR